MNLTPLLLLASLVAGDPSAKPAEPDLAALREMLQDRQDPRAQSQAALLIVRSADPAAEKIVRAVLVNKENEEAFVAMTSGVRLCQDGRFVDELLAAYSAQRPRVRQAAAEAVASLATADVVKRISAQLSDRAVDARAKPALLWTLGKSGRQDAAGVLVAHLDADGDDLRRVAAAGLTDLTGITHGLDAEKWKGWWVRAKEMDRDQWSQMRLGFQASRVLRLEGELLRARAQVLRLHQQVFSRLAVGERFGYLQMLSEQDDPGVRAVAVVWVLELMPSADAENQKQLSALLHRLSGDGAPEVQRAAVLALGRLNDAGSFTRLCELTKANGAAVRSAAVRALAAQAKGASAEAKARLKQVVPLLQKALEDKALDVVVDAAESLGQLGVCEAGPVLLGLLAHASESVRQAAAQALERSADASLVEGLMKSLDAGGVAVRFSLLGALGRAAGSTPAIPADQRRRVLAKVQVLLLRDADAGVRSRAATVLGELGDHEALPSLWQQVTAATDERVQEKAWDAFIDIVVRSGTVTVVDTWDRRMAQAKQGSRRVQLWARVYARWDQLAPMRDQASKALEGLIQANIDLGKWSAAAPLVQNLLSRSTDVDEAFRRRCLGWWLQSAEMAHKEKNRTEALRLIQEARSYLPKGDKLTEAFDALEKQAAGRE